MKKPEIVIKQIKEKEYYKKFVNEYGEILIVTITYYTTTKEHLCLIEKI